MAERKYILTDDTMKLWGAPGTAPIELHRIRAVKDFANIEAGDLGGWVESEANLSHEGNCWVCDQAKVYGGARVYEDASVFWGATVCGKSKISGHARIHDRGTTIERSAVTGQADVRESSHVSNSVIMDNVGISGVSSVKNSDLGGCISISELSHIENLDLYGNYVVLNGAWIKSEWDYASAVGFDADCEPIVFYNAGNGIHVFSSEFEGSIEDFEKWAYCEELKLLVHLMQLRFKNRKEGK